MFSLGICYLKRWICNFNWSLYWSNWLSLHKVLLWINILVVLNCFFRQRSLTGTQSAVLTKLPMITPQIPMVCHKVMSSDIIARNTLGYFNQNSTMAHPSLCGVEWSATWPDVTQRPPLSDRNLPRSTCPTRSVSLLEMDSRKGVGQVTTSWSRFRQTWLLYATSLLSLAILWTLNKPYNLEISCKIFKIYIFYSEWLL